MNQLKMFPEFERMYEAERFLVGSLLAEGEFDKFAKELAMTNKGDIVSLNPMLNKHMKIRKDAMNKRVRINMDMAKEPNSEKKEKMNNDLVKVNNDEADDIEQNEKDLARWVGEQMAPMNFLMRSRLEEIDLEVLEEEHRKLRPGMDDTAKERMEDMIDGKEQTLEARAEKLRKLIDDRDADTGDEDEDMEKGEKEAGEAEIDYDASGDVSPAEKKVKQQKDKASEKSPLNQI